MQDFDQQMLAIAFRKYHAGESIADDEILEMIRYLEPMEVYGWVLDSRFSLFLREIREITSRLRGFMSSRIQNGRWNPTTNPKFMWKGDPDDSSQ